MELLTGTVPVNKLLLAGTVPVNKFLLAGTPKSISFKKCPHPLKVPPLSYNALLADISTIERHTFHYRETHFSRLINFTSVALLRDMSVRRGVRQTSN